MSGNGNNEEPPPEDVLPAVQNAMTDVRRVMGPVFGFGLDKASPGFSKTSFDGFDLNDMIEMIDNARPGDMEAVGDALYTASGKIEQIGIDLGKHIEGVDWEGEAGAAFRRWGRGLANNTKKLGTYTGLASTQLKAAGMGLAMVKNSMPPRDDGTGPSVKDIKTPAQVDTNPDFVKAEKADAKREENRQEAIIQMTKLSSYYQVSHETLASEDPPVFKPMPNVGVPKPTGDVITAPGGSNFPNQPTAGNAGSVSSSGSEGPSSVSESTVHASAVAPGQSGGVTGPSSGMVMPDQQVGTEIDSVNAPPAPGTDPTARPVTPTAPGPTGPNATPPLGPVMNPAPVRPIGPTAPNITGNPRQAAPTGPNTGRTAPIGRPTGPGPTTGPGGRAVSPPMVPRTGPQPGIIGGKPSTTGPSTGASRIPRGTVVGNEQSGRPPMGRGPMGMGPGVPGGGTGGNSSARRLASTPGGIVGTPRTATGGPVGRAFTPGGTGLVRGGGANSGNAIGMAPRGHTPTGRDRERNESRRPDYLVEDEETWTTGRRESAPPVVE